MDRVAGVTAMTPRLLCRMLSFMHPRASSSDQRLRHAANRLLPRHQLQLRLHQLRHHQVSAHCNLDLTVEVTHTARCHLPRLKTVARSAKATEDVEL